MLHLWCGAFWLGALWPLLQVARHDDPLTAALAARFGRIALYLVGVLLAAGALLACRLLGSLAALWSSDYGRMLSLKLLLVAACCAPPPSTNCGSRRGLRPAMRVPRCICGARSMGLEMRPWQLDPALVTAAFT
jgi:hypothetical protein